jgi:hypothetical protein
MELGQTAKPTNDFVRFPEKLTARALRRLSPPRCEGKHISSNPPPLVQPSGSPPATNKFFNAITQPLTVTSLKVSDQLAYTFATGLEHAGAGEGSFFTICSARLVL